MVSGYRVLGSGLRGEGLLGFGLKGEGFSGLGLGGVCVCVCVESHLCDTSNTYSQGKASHIRAVRISASTYRDYTGMIFM